MNSRPLKKDFFSVKQFADCLEIHTNTVYRAIKEGHIQAFRVGIGSRSSFRISKSEIQRMSKFLLEDIIDNLVKEKICKNHSQKNNLDS